MDIDVGELAAARAELTAAVAKKAEGHSEILAGIKRCKAAGLKITTIAQIIGVNRDTVYQWMGEKTS